uniref:Acyl-CoA thioesterase II n=1 Tax=Panagrellus redivivus TaxID=6233 RepID=A0A7E4VFW6_PANRE
MFLVALVRRQSCSAVLPRAVSPLVGRRLQPYRCRDLQWNPTSNLSTTSFKASFTVNGEIPVHNPNNHLKQPSNMSTEETIVSEELLKLFILDEQDANTYVANHLGDGTWITNNVYGGSLFAQSLIAASKTVTDNFVPHAMHSLFILNASTQYPVTYKILRIRDGRSFCTRFVQAEQNGQIVYTTQISFHVVEAPAISHQISMPQVKPPEECLPTWEIAQNFLDKNAAGELTLTPHQLGDCKAKIAEKDMSLVEIRHVEPDLQFGITPHNHQTYYYWVRVRASIPPEDRAQHRALAAYITDATLVSAANRPHISQGFLPSMLVSLDNNTWFHTDEFRTDEWMLYENDSPIADHGRAFSTGRLWRRDGRLLLSAAQESLSRTKAQKSSL